jgi:hypothetical protein
MSKCLFVIVSFFFILGKVDAQVTDAKTKTAVDTASILKELSDLLHPDESPISYATIEVGIGNRLFNVRNKSLNAKQTTTGTLVYTPTLSYFHKSGFSIAASANLLNDMGKGFGVSQVGLSPGYDYSDNKNFSTGIAYTRYFVKDLYSPYAIPVQNDLYGYFSYKKYWLETGLALDYAAGVYKQVKTKDSIANNTRRKFYDSASFNIKTFSMIFSVGHNFEWNGLLNDDDGLNFTPTVMLNFGSSKTNITHNTNASRLLNFLNKKGRLPKIQTSSFAAESIGLNLNLGYSIGKFSFQPQLYFDYYLPQLDVNKLSTLFTFTAAYSF